MPSTGHRCTWGALRLINLPTHELLFLFVSLQSLQPGLCFSKPELPPDLLGFYHKPISLQNRRYKPISLQSRRCKLVMRKKLFPKSFWGGDSPVSALGPARLGQGRARATVTYPGQGQSCSAWEQHLPKAHQLILTASSISAEHCKIHRLHIWMRKHLAPMAHAAVVQPALPSASPLRKRSDPLMLFFPQQKILFLQRQNQSNINCKLVYKCTTKNIAFKRIGVSSSDFSFLSGIYKINIS